MTSKNIVTLTTALHEENDEGSVFDWKREPVVLENPVSFGMLPVDTPDRFDIDDVKRIADGDDFITVTVAVSTTGYIEACHSADPQGCDYLHYEVFGFGLTYDSSVTILAVWDGYLIVEYTTGLEGFDLDDERE